MPGFRLRGVFPCGITDPIPTLTRGVITPSRQGGDKRRAEFRPHGRRFGANGQGKSREECLASLREAIALILEHKLEESLRALPPDAKQELVVIG
jgi:hypothetical protein